MSNARVAHGDMRRARQPRFSFSLCMFTACVCCARGHARSLWRRSLGASLRRVVLCKRAMLRTCFRQKRVRLEGKKKISNLGRRSHQPSGAAPRPQSVAILAQVCFRTEPQVCIYARKHRELRGNNTVSGGPLRRQTCAQLVFWPESGHF